MPKATSTPEERATASLDQAQRRFTRADDRVAALHEQLQNAQGVLEDAARRLQYAEQHPDLPSGSDDVSAVTDDISEDDMAETANG